MLFAVLLGNYHFLILVQKQVSATHRRRIELEDKAKVVVSFWGTESLPR